LTGYSPGYGVCYFDPLYEAALKGGLNGRPGLLLLLGIIPFSLMQLWGYICLGLTIFLVLRRGGFTALIQQSRLCAFSTFYGVSLIYGTVGSYEYIVRGKSQTNRDTNPLLLLILRLCLQCTRPDSNDIGSASLLLGNKPINDYLLCKLSQWVTENLRQPIPDCPLGAPSDPGNALPFELSCVYSSFLSST
jgi:hypothetical protein